jgi:hypothetical protein
MLFSNTIVGLAAVAVAVVEAAAPPAVTATSSPFKVSVGADGLTYTPSNIIAEVGTLIEFDFFPKVCSPSRFFDIWFLTLPQNHTVTQSSFKDPCHPLSTGGFFSGFVPTMISPSGTTFTITVNDAKPIWFYCSQTVGTHCQKGMVGAINAPATGNTLDAFILLASNATQSTFPPGGAVGGVLQVGSNSNLSTSASTTYTTSYTTSAESTSAIVTTYTSASSTYTSTIGSSTIFTTESTVVPAATGSPVQVGVSGASSMSANLFGVAAVLFGAMAMM